MSKYGHRTVNWFEAIVNKLGGEEGAEAFLRGELVVSKPTRSWREKDGVIYFSVTSDGTTGEDWIKRFKSKGFFVDRRVESILRSPDFVPTSGVTTEVAVLKGDLFSDNDRITKNILAEADKRKFLRPSAELACLTREKFTDEEFKQMNLRHVTPMHQAINRSILGITIPDDGFCPLCAYFDWDDMGWSRDCAFVFIRSKPIE